MNFIGLLNCTQRYQIKCIFKFHVIFHISINLWLVSFYLSYIWLRFLVYNRLTYLISFKMPARHFALTSEMVLPRLMKILTCLTEPALLFLCSWLWRVQLSIWQLAIDFNISADGEECCSWKNSVKHANADSSTSIFKYIFPRFCTPLSCKCKCIEWRQIKCEIRTNKFQSTAIIIQWGE